MENEQKYSRYKMTAKRDKTSALMRERHTK